MILGWSSFQSKWPQIEQLTVFRRGHFCFLFPVKLPTAACYKPFNVSWPTRLPRHSYASQSSNSFYFQALTLISCQVYGNLTSGSRAVHLMRHSRQGWTFLWMWYCVSGLRKWENRKPETRFLSWLNALGHFAVVSRTTWYLHNCGL